MYVCFLPIPYRFGISYEHCVHFQSCVLTRTKILFRSLVILLSLCITGCVEWFQEYFRIFFKGNICCTVNSKVWVYSSDRHAHSTSQLPLCPCFVQYIMSQISMRAWITWCYLHPGTCNQVPNQICWGKKYHRDRRFNPNFCNQWTLIYHYALRWLMGALYLNDVLQIKIILLFVIVV